MEQEDSETDGNEYRKEEEMEHEDKEADGNS